jgi:hypothetical protein
MLQLRLDILHHLLDGPGRNRAFGAGLPDPDDKLFPVKFLPPSIMFGHHQSGGLNPFISGESKAATLAFPPAPYAVFHHPGVGYLGIAECTIGTMHILAVFLK